jgi:hypothetical protein
MIYPFEGIFFIRHVFKYIGRYRNVTVIKLYQKIEFELNFNGITSSARSSTAYLSMNKTFLISIRKSKNETRVSFSKLREVIGFCLIFSTTVQESIRLRVHADFHVPIHFHIFACINYWKSVGQHDFEKKKMDGTHPK